jgi:CRP/FNR family transcriptional regulator
MTDITKILSAIPLYSGLPSEQLEEITRIVVHKQYQKNERIFSEGDDGIGFFVVASGRVKIYKLSSEGKEQILHIFGPGEPFGEVPVFAGNPFPANAETLQKSTLLFFPKDRFVQLITQNPSLSLNMLAVLSMRLRQFTIQIENLSLKEVPARLASYLIYLADEQQSNLEVTLNISKGQLASLLGTIPETLSRIFNRMSAQGLIQVSGRKIKLIDKKRIGSLADKGRTNL